MMNIEKSKSDTADRELSIDELDSTSAGCPAWLGPVAVAIAFRAWIRSLF